MAQSLARSPNNSIDTFPTSIENFAAMRLRKEVVDIDMLNPVPGNVRAKQFAGQRGVHPNHGTSFSPNSRLNNGAPNKSEMNVPNMTWLPSVTKRPLLVSNSYETGVPYPVSSMSFPGRAREGAVRNLLLAGEL